MVEPSSINLVIYHADCSDGFGAAYAAWKLLGDRATYHAAPETGPQASFFPLPASHQGFANASRRGSLELRNEAREPLGRTGSSDISTTRGVRP